MAQLAEDLELSLGQREFADRMDCRQAMRCGDEAVCLYRVVDEETIRWIVDTDGSVLDWTVFHATS